MPGWRPDLRAPIDLVEEVVRLEGLAGLPGAVLAEHGPLTLGESLTLALGLDLVLRDLGEDARCHPT